MAGKPWARPAAEARPFLGDKSHKWSRLMLAYHDYVDDNDSKDNDDDGVGGVGGVGDGDEDDGSSGGDGDVDEDDEDDNDDEDDDDDNDKDVVLCLLWTGLTCDPALCVDNEELTAARFGVELVQILDAADVKLWVVPRGNVSKKTAPVEK